MDPIEHTPAPPAHAYTYANTMEDFYRLQSGYTSSVVIYSASWCGPCVRLKEWLNESFAASTFPIVVVDVDNEAVKMLTENVEAMPTIEVYQNGERTHVMQGFQKDKLQSVLRAL
jgi:thiol-disulfide isomerase/thioredoxin